MQIFCFGDSITWGGSDAQGGWADRLKRLVGEYVDKHPGEWLEVYNLGIPGDSTDGLVRRFANETKERLDAEGKPIFLFAFGANDACLIENDRAFLCPIENFETNYRQVITDAKKLADSIFLLTITPVDETKRVQTERIRKNEYIDKYNDIIKRLAEHERLGLIDVNQAYLENGYADLFGDDGLHPNIKGHDLILSLVRPRLEI